MQIYTLNMLNPISGIYVILFLRENIITAHSKMTDYKALYESRSAEFD